jgi:hypothetical protein
MILEKEDGGFIVTRVTDMTKTIKFGPAEVNARVVWELDVADDGETVEEEELRFEAFGDSGTIGSQTGWNLGELPLELGDVEPPTFESTWIAGFGEALAGHTMLANPADKKTHKNKQYLQAFAPDVIGDCAKVTDPDVAVEIELEDPEGVLECDSVLIRESSTAFDGEGGVQLKSYCPEVGLVLIDGHGGPDGQEMAQLISIRTIPVNCTEGSELEEWRDAVKALEAKAYNPGPGDPPSPAPYQPPNGAVCNTAPGLCPNHEPVVDPCQ